jgi:hypothetical protein
VKKYDKSSQWLIQHHGDSIVRLAGEGRIAAWRPAKSELVQPQRIPDGLLEVWLEGEQEPNLYLVEIYSTPDRRQMQALADDLMLTYLGRKVVPEVVALFLSQGDGTRVPPRLQLMSRQGWSRLEVSWHAVELWTVPAEELLAANDVGLIPWVPLAKFDGPPEVIVEQCRERIEQQAPAAEKPNLLAVTQVLMRLRYDDPGLFGILGGERTMIESPLIQELLGKRAHKDLLLVLEGRFGSVPPELATQLRTIVDEEKLDELMKQVGVCPTLQAFQALLAR